MTLTGKDIFSACKEHMPNWHCNYAKGKRNIEIITELSDLLGIWIDLPRQGASFKTPEVQTFLKTLIKMIEDRGNALDKFYVQDKKNLG